MKKISEFKDKIHTITSNVTPASSEKFVNTVNKLKDFNKQGAEPLNQDQKNSLPPTHIPYEYKACSITHNETNNCSFIKKYNKLIIISALSLFILLIISVFSICLVIKNDNTNDILNITSKEVNFDVNIQINCNENLLFSKYDVELYINGELVGEIKHGTSGMYTQSLPQGNNIITFANKENENVNAVVEVDIDGDINFGYILTCKSSAIEVETEFIEKLDDIGKDDLMILVDSSDYHFRLFNEVENELKQLGFTNITLEEITPDSVDSVEDGQIDSVSINGNTIYKRGDIFSKNSPVIITYFINEEEDPPLDVSVSPLHYSGTFEEASDGNSGIYAYKFKNNTNPYIYYIIDFNEGFVYRFYNKDYSNGSEKAKIVSGTLNDRMTFSYYDSGASLRWTNAIYFRYVGIHTSAYYEDHDGFQFELEPTSLETALESLAETVVWDMSM